MDRTTSFEPGTVLQPSWDSRPIRVLLSDQFEVLYDTWQPHKNGWGLASLKGRAHYYRIPTRLAVEKTTTLRMEPLTELEFLVHRPDLPLRCCRTMSATWEELSIKSDAELDQLLAKHVPEVGRELIMTTDLVLVPFGPNGGEKRPVRIHAQDEIGFTGRELLAKACIVQAQQRASKPDGVGIFRLGFEDRTPSFYLWGWRDRANNVTA